MDLEGIILLIESFPPLGLSETFCIILNKPFLSLLVGVECTYLLRYSSNELTVAVFARLWRCTGKNKTCTSLTNILVRNRYHTMFHDLPR